jgi:hypothetical protein
VPSQEKIEPPGKLSLRFCRENERFVKKILSSTVHYYKVKPIETSIGGGFCQDYLPPLLSAFVFQSLAGFLLLAISPVVLALVLSKEGLQ